MTSYVLMAEFNRHRRLMEPFCMSQCDPERNPTGVCFPFCTLACPSFCRVVEWPIFPPASSPSPATSPHTQTVSPPHKTDQQLSFPLKISLIFLLATFMYTLYKFYNVWYRSRRRHRTVVPPPSTEHQETLDDGVLDHPIWYIRTAGLHLSVINAITVVKFCNGDGVIVGTGCSVCLSEFEEDETLRLLPNCKHGFHISCIDTWLRSHKNCPVCRSGIVKSTVDEPPPEQNIQDLEFSGETDSRVSVMEDDDREEASESSGLSIGETDEDDENRNGEILLMRRSISMEDFAGSGIELVKIEQRSGG